MEVGRECWVTSFPGTKLCIGERSSLKGCLGHCYVRPRMSEQRVWIPHFHYCDYNAFLTQRPQNNDSINHWQITVTEQTIHSVWRDFIFQMVANDSIILHSWAVIDSKILHLFACILIFWNTIQTFPIHSCSFSQDYFAQLCRSARGSLTPWHPKLIGERILAAQWTLNTDTKHYTFHQMISLYLQQTAQSQY